jgi:hypothetical protein
MESLNIVCPTNDMDHPFVQHFTLDHDHVGYLIDYCIITVLGSK